MYFIIRRIAVFLFFLFVLLSISGCNGKTNDSSNPATRTVSTIVLNGRNSSPVIVLNGTNPMEIAVGAAYIEPGATALDTEDGTLPVTVSGSVDTTTPGVYVITYRAVDSEGLSVSVTREVHVILPTGVKKTGQTAEYAKYDDGYYQAGIAPSYTRDDETEIVTDNITQLMWQDDAAAASPEGMDQATAKQQCDDLTLGGFTDWRLPTIEELLSLVYKGAYDPAIDPVFQNIVSLAYYWSSSEQKQRAGYVWVVYFEAGTDHYRKATISGDAYGQCIARCVRNK